MSKIKQLFFGFLPCIVSVIIMYVVSFGAAIVYMFLGRNAAGADPSDYEELMGSLTLTATASMHMVYVIVFYLWYRWMCRKSESGDQAQELGPAQWFLLIAAGMLLQIVISTVLGMLLPLFPKAQADYEALLDSMELGTGLLPIVLTSLVAPIGEELIFRGVTMAIWEGSFPFWMVNLMQALLFGVYHMNVVQFCYASLLGLVFGIVWKKSHNLKACIVLHAAVNLSANILSLLG